MKSKYGSVEGWKCGSKKQYHARQQVVASRVGGWGSGREVPNTPIADYRLPIADWLIRFLYCLLLAACCLLTAFGDARGYGPQRTEINAGVLVLENPNPALPFDQFIGQSASRDWYTFFAMDSRNDVKPFGWEFVNPYAPPGTAKNQRAYWAVLINTLSAEQLQRYHVLLLSVRTNNLSLTLDTREKLRRFVDGGGILWLDTPPGGWGRVSIGVVSSILLPDVNLTTNSGQVWVFNPDHPLLRGYYTLSPSEAVNLGMRGKDPNFAYALAGIPPSPPFLQPITAVGTLLNQNAPIIAAGMYGSGRILASAAGVAAAINRPLGNFSGARASNLPLVPTSELKFAYNLVRWASASIGFAKDMRRASSTFDRYGAPLALKWRDTGGTLTGSPAMYKGFVYGIQGGNLVCYDGSSTRDADGDGNPDDGIPDLSLGQPGDVVWRAQVGGQATSPLVIETSDPRWQELVVVVADGRVQAYAAVPRDQLTGRILPTPLLAWATGLPNWQSATAVDGTPIAPVYVEGILIIPGRGTLQGSRSSARFVAVWAATGDIITSGQSNFQWIQPQFQSVGDWRTQMVAGYVPNKGAGGGNDLMVYLGINNIPEMEGTPQQTRYQHGVRAFWLGAKREKLRLEPGDGTLYSCRVYRKAFIFDPTGTPFAGLRPRIYGIDSLGNIREYQIGVDVDVNLPIAGAVKFRNVPTTLGTDIYMDYFIDWRQEVGVQPEATMFRSVLLLQQVDQNNQNLAPYGNELVGLTLAPNGILYIATASAGGNNLPPVANGNLLAVLEQGVDSGSKSQLLWRWQANGWHRLAVSAEPLFLPSALLWKDQSLAFLRPPSFVYLDFTDPLDADPNDGPLSGAPQNMYVRFSQGPVYADGVVYMVGEGVLRFMPFGFPIPYTVIMAFDANPITLQIQLGAPIIENTPISLIQADYARGGRDGFANTQLTFNPRSPDPRLDVDYGTGTIRIRAFVESTSKQLDLFSPTGALSLSEPVWVSIGSFSSLVNPDANGVNGNWNNLLWYMVLPGFTATGYPAVMGSLLYVPMRGTFPDFTTSPPMLRTRGGIFAMSANPKREQPGLGRADEVTFLPLNPNEQPVIRWPSMKNLPTTSIGAFYNALLQRFRSEWTLASEPKWMAFGDGFLAVSAAGRIETDPPSYTGLHLFDRQTTVIADQNRLIEVDGEANVVWAAENSSLVDIAGGTQFISLKTSLGSDTKAYRFSPNELLVVDTDNDRVLIIDRAGNEQRILKSFLPDKLTNVNPPVQIRKPNAPTSNWVHGDPTTLRAPSDATVWYEYVTANNNPFNPSPDNNQQNPLELWIHYTIADTGNFRIVDIVDRYVARVIDNGNGRFSVVIEGPVIYNDSNNNISIPMLGVLNWISPTTSQGKTYRYVGVQRFQSGLDSQGQPIFAFASLVANYRAEAITPGPQGTLQPQHPEEGMIILQVNQGGGTQLSFCRRMNVPGINEPQPIRNPSSISVRQMATQGGTEVRVMVTTSTGVYELRANPANDTWDVTWALTGEVYSNFVRRKLDGLDVDTGNAPIKFQPRQAKRLANGNVLITNSYTGRTTVLENNRPKQVEFFGEVFEIVGNQYRPGDPDQGFSPTSIVWSTLDNPPLTGSSQLKAPTFADREF